MVHMLDNDDVIRNSFSECAFVAQPGHKSEDFFRKSGFIQNLQRMLGRVYIRYPLLMGLLELCLGLPEALKMIPVYTNDFCYCSASLPQMKL